MIFKKKNQNADESCVDLGQNPDAAADSDLSAENERTNAKDSVDTSSVDGLEDALNQAEKEVAENDPVKELEKALSEEKDRTLRLYAEMDNVRRRAARELVDERKYSGMEVIRAILPAMDNLQRAIEAAEKLNADDPLLEGVRMVLQQMSDALKKNNCTKIEALKQPFDPNFHEAISQMPSAELPENTVMIVAQDGYILNGRVVRPSQVVVSKKVKI